MAELLSVMNRTGEDLTSNLQSSPGVHDVNGHVAGIRRSAVLSHSTLSNFDTQA